ncbi:hypothetical protein HIM_02871 [Hirsutella minnesotensis 3608]|nr:hypothetical protein HIM_02871 [Hirsutella minnesotensis 3608]
MAAISSTATALTPPSSSHGGSPTWEHGGVAFENATDDSVRAATRSGPLQKVTTATLNGLASHPIKGPQRPEMGPEMGARKTHSAEHLSATRRDRSAGERVMSTPTAIEPKNGRTSPSEWSLHAQQTTSDARKRPRVQIPSQDSHGGKNDDSKWIHRDKLAKIENEELQAAGLYVPRSRASSKQRRDRSQNRIARGTDSTDRDRVGSRNNSVIIDHAMPAQEPSSPHWDLRTPEEIAQEEANAYFITNGGRSSSRIPVAKISPAPIPLDCLERGSQAVKKPDTSSDVESLAYSKPRSRSTSLSVSDNASGANAGAQPNPRRSATDTSPKKAPRKSSVTSRSSISTTGRAKPRTGPSKDSPSNRPPTRAGDLSTTNKAPEGDPPWMVNSYKPDPRLPPDQQLLPTVARRLQQEKWEKEGKFGDVYDKEFRPLNDNELLRPPVPLLDTEQASNADVGVGDEDHEVEKKQERMSGEWPLKLQVSNLQGGPLSPKLRQGSYSTMPRISDRPSTDPLSPRSPAAHQPPPLPAMQGASDAPVAVERVMEMEKEKDKKGLCGCCTIM